MTIEAVIVLALWWLCAWFVTDHLVTHQRNWEQDDLGEVDLSERTRERAVKESDREARLDREAKIRASLHADIVTRRERMRHHPQPWHL